MHNLEEELKKLKNQKTLPLNKMSKTFATSLDQTLSRAAFKLYQDKKFRQLVNFENISKIEQDRIFNELVISYLILLMLTLEAPDLRVSQELKEYFQLVKDELPKAHISYLKELGIENRYLEDWKKLIAMRYDEYQKNKLEIRSAAIEMELKDKDLSWSDFNDIQMLIIPQTIAIGCLTHICRGKTEKKDELFKLILKNISRFYVEIRIPLEGGKITWWRKLLIKIKTLFHKLNI